MNDQPDRANDLEAHGKAWHSSALRHWLFEIADLPIGHVAFVALALGGLAWTHWGSLQAGEYVGAVAAASGLLAVGHGIRHHRRP